MTTTPSTRRLSLAITAAVASTTLAIGVTTAALLGWLSPPGRSADAAAETPAEQPAEAGPIIYVPIAPAPAPSVGPARGEVTLAMHEADHDDGEEHEHRRERHHGDEDDDD